MNPEDALIFLARWLHILSATLALGVPIYIRCVQLPTLASLDEATRTQLNDVLASRWRKIIYLAIFLFLATGFYNFLAPHAHWRQFPERDQRVQYHMVFGIKLLLALVMFFLASALAGRSAALAYFRNNAKTWYTVLVILGLILLGLSTTLRFMPLQQSPT
jgi:uncharacterized membrane protein